MKTRTTMYHKPVMLAEVIEGLNIKPGGTYVDLTYGGGGHSKAILDRVGEGRVIAFDQDTDALTNKVDDERLTLIHSNFRFLKNFLKLYKAVPVDGMLADLGISSHQIDEATRGFSTRFDGPLDLRMNRMQELTAALVVNQYDEPRLKFIFRSYCELAHAGFIAAEICKQRSTNKIETTGQLMEVLASITPKNRINKIGAQVFQALRIEVNDELGALQDMLIQAVELLKTGGRLVVLTYHSLEDRCVKNFFKAGNFEGNIEKDFFGNPNLLFKMVNRKPILASAEELSENSRARSAKLRIGEKL